MAEMQSTRFCTACGNELDKGAAFCGHCGVAAEGSVARAGADHPHSATMNEPNSSGSSHRGDQSTRNSGPDLFSTPVEEKRSKFRIIALSVVGVLAIIGVFAIIGALVSPGSSGSIRAVVDPRPQGEIDFLRIVSTAEADGNTQNEIQQDSARADRGTSLCRDVFHNGTSVSGWIGTVKEVGTSAFDGSASLKIGVTDSITLETVENTITKGSELYNTLANIAIGDKVAFSGRFVPATDGRDCIQELSLTTVGSLSEPEYLFRFTSISKTN
jgi:hypothetical protein